MVATTTMNLTWCCVYPRKNALNPTTSTTIVIIITGNAYRANGSGDVITVINNREMLPIQTITAGIVNNIMILR